jgi:hypothetical protein
MKVNGHGYFTGVKDDDDELVSFSFVNLEVDTSRHSFLADAVREVLAERLVVTDATEVAPSNLKFNVRYTLTGDFDVNANEWDLDLEELGGDLSPYNIEVVFGDALLEGALEDIRDAGLGADIEVDITQITPS